MPEQNPVVDCDPERAGDRDRIAMKTIILLAGPLVVAGLAGLLLGPAFGAVTLVVAGLAWIVHQVAMRRLRNELGFVPRAALSVVGALLLIQLVPYGRAHDNPPVISEPVWDSAETRTLAVAACYDCHSNETRWPLYTGVAPASWITQRHVDEGREKLNFSDWSQPREADEAAETVRDGEMPPRDYLLIHPEARLDEAQKRILIAGLAATTGSDGEEEDDD